MSYPASVIAYAFVKKGIDTGQPVTQMKLQKMVYFAHGFHLAQFNVPLIKEDFQAWKFGPVVREIYDQYKLYGSSEISDTYFLFSSFDIEKELERLDENAKESIEFTWEALKDVNALALSSWTHKEDSPWSKSYKSMELDISIDNEDIKNYFKEFLTKEDGATS